MNLVERDNELTTLGRLFEACAQGKGTIAYIVGPVGSGKTALMHVFAERTVRYGAVYLSATASRAERTLPFGILGQLFRCAEMPAAIAGCAASLLNDPKLAATLGGPEPTTIASATACVFEGIRRLLLELTENPVVISVDDIQYADALSLQCLLYLARRMRVSRMLMILSECTQLSVADAALRTELLRQPHCHRIRLSPLPESGVASLLTEYMDPPSAQRLATACYEVSGGNPLLVRALAEDRLTADEIEPASVVFGSAFAEALTACLHRCEPTLVSLAGAIAILADSASVVLLGEMLDRSVESITRGISLLEAAGLLDGCRFRHDAARSAVLEGITSEDRTAMQLRAAELLYRYGASATVLARHVIAVDRLAVPWVGPVLQEAAACALADDEFELAIRYLRRAQAECADRRQLATITAKLIRAEWLVDPATAERHLPVLAAALKERLLPDCYAIDLLYYLLWYGRTSDAAEFMAILQPRPENTTAGTQAASLEAVRRWLACSYPDLAKLLSDIAAGGKAMRDRARTQTRQPDGGAVLARALCGVADDDPLIAAERVLQGCHLNDVTLGPIALAVVALISTDRLDRASFWCRQLLEEAAVRDIPTCHAVFAAIYALIEVRRGNLPSAENHARAALTLLTPKGWGVAVGGPLASMLLVTSALGKYEEAAGYLRIPVPEAMFQTPCGLLYLHARGRYYMAVNRLHAALADFQSCGELMTRWELDLPALVPWRTDAAWACLRMGEIRRARELAREQLSRTAPQFFRTRGMSLRMIGLASHPRQRPAILREAAEALLDSGDKLELAYTFADLSEVHRALGESTRASLMARQAFRLAQQCGAGSLMSTLLHGTNGMEPETEADSSADAAVLAELSEAQRRVAVLAGQGYTNRQIADKLCITVSTVEQHLTRAYRKLKVNRRSDLPLGLQRQLTRDSSERAS